MSEELRPERPERASYYERIADWCGTVNDILRKASDSPAAYDTVHYAFDPAVPGEVETAGGAGRRNFPEPALQAQRRLGEAVRYVLLAPGKRLRPILYLATRDLLACTDAISTVDRCFIAAIEMIHNYSLVHDDLPAMDNDDLRRGRLSCHRAFDEATAILAGDALLTRAMELLFRAVAAATDETEMRRVLRAASLVTERAGTRGMIGGQMIDLFTESVSIPSADDERFPAAAASLKQIQLRKTAALIEAPMLSAALIYEAPQEVAVHLGKYASALGRAYQIRDDLLDAEGRADDIGKTPGKDAAAGKWTEVTLYGKEARNNADALRKEIDAACEVFDRYGYSSRFFRQLAEVSARRVK